MFNTPNNLFSIEKLISGASRFLNITQKFIPLYEKSKPTADKLLNYVKKVINNQNNQKDIKKTTVLKNSSSKNNNPTFFI